VQKRLEGPWALFYRRNKGPCKHGLTIYIKTYLKAKEELLKFKYFTMQKYTKSSKKNPQKRNQNPSRYHHNSIMNLKVQHKPKYHLPKILI
jgi:hypothetical protein